MEIHVPVILIHKFLRNVFWSMDKSVHKFSFFIFKWCNKFIEVGSLHTTVITFVLTKIELSTCIITLIFMKIELSICTIMLMFMEIEWSTYIITLMCSRSQRLNWVLVLSHKCSMDMELSTCTFNDCCMLPINCLYFVCVFFPTKGQAPAIP